MYVFHQRFNKNKLKIKTSQFKISLQFIPSLFFFPTKINEIKP